MPISVFFEKKTGMRPFLSKYRWQVDIASTSISRNIIEYFATSRTHAAVDNVKCQ